MGKNITLIVMGDEGSGKTSIIRAFISKHFSFDVEPIAPDSIVPSMQEFTSSQSESVTILDSFASEQYRDILKARLTVVDTAIILFDATRPESLERIENIWLPLVRAEFGDDKCRSAVLVVTKGNLLSEEDSVSLRNSMAGTLNSFRSKFPFLYATYDLPANSDPGDFEKIFSIAESIALFPRAPLYNIAEKVPCFTPLALQALQRIFRIHDLDRDCLLSDEEFAMLHSRCLEIDITVEEIRVIKRRVLGTIPGEDVTKKSDGITPRKSRQSRTSSSAPSPSCGNELTRDDLFVIPCVQKGTQEVDVETEDLIVKGWFTFRGFLTMFEMLFANDRVNRVLWAVLKYHGYQPEDMECPYEDKEEESVGVEEPESTTNGGIGRGKDESVARSDRTTLSREAEDFLEYVYYGCTCRHFQVPGMSEGSGRFRDMYSMVQIHLDHLNQMGSLLGLGYDINGCFSDLSSRNQWMACWKGLAALYPSLTKKILFALGLVLDGSGYNDDEADFLYLDRYSPEEWLYQMRERSVLRVAMFSGFESLRAEAVPDSSLELLSALTGCNSRDANSGIQSSRAVTSTFTGDLPRKKGRQRYYIATSVPQQIAAEWSDAHIEDYDVAVLVFDSVGRDGRGGKKSLEYLESFGESIVASNKYIQRLFVCVDMRVGGISVFGGDDIVDNSSSNDGEEEEEEVKNTRESARAAVEESDGGDVSDEGKNAFHCAVDYIKKADLPQVEKVSPLELGKRLDSGIVESFCGTLEDILPKRLMKQGGVLSGFTFWIMGWASALWNSFRWLFPSFSLRLHSLFPF